MSDATFSLLTDRISHDFFSSNDLGSRVTMYLRDEALLIFASKKNLRRFARSAYGLPRSTLENYSFMNYDGVCSKVCHL